MNACESPPHNECDKLVSFSRLFASMGQINLGPERRAAKDYRSRLNPYLRLLI